MAQAVNIWDVAGISPAGYVGGNPNFGDMARTSDSTLWMFIGTDNRNPAHWQVIGTQSTDGSGLEQGVDIKDEGVVKVNNVKTLNFVGGSVTATATGGTTSEATIDVSGGGGDGYTFAGTFTAQDIIDNGVFYASTGTLPPIWNEIGNLLKLDVISLQANEVIVDMVVQCNEAFTLSQVGIDNGSTLTWFVKEWVIGGYSDHIINMPAGANPNASGLQRYLNSPAVAPLYMYNTQAPYNYSLFFMDSTGGIPNVKDTITNATGSITIWYKKTTLPE